MKHKFFYSRRVLLVLIPMILILFASCTATSVFPDAITPDPEPTVVPFTISTSQPTITPTIAPTITPTIAPTAESTPTASVQITPTPIPSTAPTSVPVTSADSVIAKGTVYGSKLYLRKGPSTSYSVVDTLHSKDKLNIHAVDGNWLRVSSPDSGLEGYVFGKYVALDGASIVGYGFGVTTGNVNLRAEATSKSDLLAVVPKGSAVTINSSDRVTGFYSVTVHDTLAEGFISPLYIHVVARVRPSVSSVENKTGYISGNVVNFRSGPGTGYRVIDQLTKNEKLEILSVGINWYKVQITKTCVARVQTRDRRCGCDGD